MILTIAVTINLVILGFFKYYGFFLETLGELFWKLGIERDLPLFEVILPVGISFFTFQGISYIVDIYRGKIEVDHTLLDMMLYISFFPQLVAGPIVRAADFIPQLQVKPCSDQLLASMGLLLIVWGLFKKAIIANYLAVDLVDPVFFDPTAYSSWDLLMASYGYAVQIYCDFSAYSDIAIGVAALLGYHFPKNFNQPYRSASLREFWQRWHISLSSWLRDYLYIPLGGNQQNIIRTYRNVFITMFLGGIWHGAAWTFIIWGSLHGIALIVERFIKNSSTTHYFATYLPTITHGLKVFLIFHFICFAWIFFRASSLETALQFLTTLNHWEISPTLATPLTISLILFGLGIHFTPSQTLTTLERLFSQLPLTMQGLSIGIIIITIEAFGMEGVAPFIYFQF
jgi:D-alanyl-lipoteichoic acid acyltransferase DltB (MBOAT superfamily)